MTNRTDELLSMFGRIIGENVRHKNKYYVYDGKVYLVTDATLEELGDYFEFCDKLRRGGFPGFKPVNFHLENKE